MRLRSTGHMLAAALTAMLLATSMTASAAGWQGQYREDTCFDEAPTQPIGQPGETVVGTEDDDVIIGGGRVAGLGGNDLICDAKNVKGGPGDDRIRMLDGGTARGNGGNDELFSIALSETAVGATLIGGPGGDIFWGGTMGDNVRGGSGDDVAHTGGGDDLIDLGSGNDEGYGGPGDDRFSGDTGDDFMDGSTGDDFMDGGTDADRADGGPGKDQCLAVEDRTSCRRVKG